jgi:arylsulfatase A-like enzyme
MLKRLAGIGLAALVASSGALAAPQQHNVILFVPDGLRAKMVTPETAPAMAALRDSGVNFKNSHSIFPTFTTANASAFATGHFLGDTGDFSNAIYAGYLVPTAGNTMTPFLESDPILGDVDEHFGGDYLNETTLLKAAIDAGYNAAAVGKVGPTLIFAHTMRDGQRAVVIDDQTGSEKGIALPNWLAEDLSAASLPIKAPGRADNGKPGTNTTPGTLLANLGQQSWFTTVLTQFVLPKFKADGKPFVIVYWSRDPDGTQHNQGDSLNKLEPGINGPTSLKAIRNADDNLATIRKTLADLGLDASTDIVISADHGFSTISRESQTSPAAKATYDDTPAGFLPPGFLAIDLSKALGLKLWDPDKDNSAVGANTHPSRGHGLIGPNPMKPKVVIAANGGSDLVYLPQPIEPGLTQKAIDALLAQDYVSGLFVDDALGKFAGTLPMSAINMKGTAVTPNPSIVVNFKSFTTGCAEPTTCAVEVADTNLQQGQGMHGTLSRADTYNFTAAIGPDFRSGVIDDLPVSNADIGKTLAHLMGLKIKANGKLLGRVAIEAMPGGKAPAVVAKTLVSEPSAEGLMTILNYQLVGETKYFDAAGFLGRTVGLVEEK